MKKEVVIDDVTYYVAKPTSVDESNAKLCQSKIFSKALQNGACLKDELDKALKNRGVWDEKDDEEVQKYSDRITQILEELDEGGIDVMEARKMAIEANNLRIKVIQKLSVLRQHNSLTAEGQADDAYFDSLVSSCCYKEDGTKVFKSYEDYINKSNETYAAKLARELSELIYGSGDYVKEFPENKFLTEYGFINDELEYIDEEGNLVDENYKVVNKEEPKKEKKPFLKNGQPIEK